MMEYICSECGARYGEDALVWRCTCGGLLGLPPPRAFDAAQVDVSEPGLWRYAAALPTIPAARRIRIGETMTPLSGSGCLGLPAHFKLESLLPTGSYKDRGSAVLVSKLHALGLTEILEDSSGNAGASIAAYAAASGMRCTIYAPAANSPGKLAQIRAYGARLVPIPGDRAAVAAAAMAAAQSAFYASHIWLPPFVAGVATMGFEIWEQLGRQAPDTITMPAGHGSVLLGLWRAFTALRRAGVIGQLPRLYAVQSAAFPALAEAWEAGAGAPVPTVRGTTIAEGIACRVPLRGKAALSALRATGGAAFTVTEAEIQGAWARLAGGGYYVEPSAAVAGAGFLKLCERGVLDASGVHVVILTGSGLKAPAV
jgi:threonine synthase